MTVTTSSDGLQLRNKQPPQLEANFAEERPGWRGYVEWEKYPEKKKKAAEILAQYKFPDVRLKHRNLFDLNPSSDRLMQPPEFQLDWHRFPQSNPLLPGTRWKQYHKALGPSLENVPDISWDYVQKEKSEDMLHVLQFPYNGEPPRVRMQMKMLHLSI